MDNRRCIMVIDQKAAKDIFTFHHFVTQRQGLEKMFWFFEQMIFISATNNWQNRDKSTFRGHGLIMQSYCERITRFWMFHFFFCGTAICILSGQKALSYKMLMRWWYSLVKLKAPSISLGWSSRSSEGEYSHQIWYWIQSVKTDWESCSLHCFLWMSLVF